MRERTHIGKRTPSVAAAVIYISSTLMDERRTQKEISEIARVTEVTIRNRYKELIEKLELEIEIQI